MSLNFKFNNIKKYFTLRNLISCFFVSLILIPFILIYLFALKKTVFDAMSVAACLYICLGLLGIIFEIAKFNTLDKLKRFFIIKKENKEEFTNFEKSQMKVLNFKVHDEKEKTKKNKESFKFIFIFQIIYGIILICISLPFIF